MLITFVWQIYRDPIGNLHTGAVQICTISAAGANLLSGTLSVQKYISAENCFHLPTILLERLKPRRRRVYVSVDMQQPSQLQCKT